MKINEQNFSNLFDNSKLANKCVIGVPLLKSTRKWKYLNQ